jgi:putative Mn2+ efflux pump MntP
LLAVGLAMDCFAVSITQAGLLKKQSVSALTYILAMACLFGLFQGMMPLITFYAGISFADKLSVVSHWIALVLLVVIGGNMIYEGSKSKVVVDEGRSALSMKRLFVLALATSIDAFSVGVLFVPYPHVLWMAVAIIGAVSFVFSLLGSGVGYWIGSRFKLNMEVIGGVILIGIGLKIFISHYM